MLTAVEKNDLNFYGGRAIDSVKAIKEIIARFENPINEMTFSEFSRAMHRELLRYDDATNKIENIYKAEFKRMFCDDEEDE